MSRRNRNSDYVCRSAGGASHRRRCDRSSRGSNGNRRRHSTLGGWAARAPAASLVLLMNLTPRELDKLLVAMAAMVAGRRLERGVKLNHPEAVALITDAVVEGARDGHSVAYLMQAGAQVLRRDQVMEGVAEMIREIQVEATFPDG